MTHFSLQGEYRTDMIESWISKLTEFSVPYNDSPSLVTTLSDPVKVRSWQIAGLPKVYFNVHLSQQKIVNFQFLCEEITECNFTVG